MKTISLIGLLGIGLMASGCTSYVKTYDANSNLIGVCKTGATLFGAPFFPMGRGHCTGSANPKDQGK